MGTVETGAKKKRAYRNVQAAALIAIGAAGLIAVAAVAPNTFQLLGRTGSLARLKYRAKKVLPRLRQKGLVEFADQGGKKYVRLTERGEAMLGLEQEKMHLADMKKKRWDKRYRLVMFDVPEKRKRVRERLRHQMREAGFLMVQDSAWVYPYDCEEYVALLKADLHIGKDVLYAVVEEIENDGWIRRHFDLPQREH